MASHEAPRRPKLSLQTKPVATSQTRTRRSALANANPRSPTTFNTLSNVYVTAIERSTPVQSTPLTAINTKQPLKLQTDLASLKDQQHRVQSPFATTYPDTPLSANPISPAQQMDIVFPSQQMTATPPLSAGPTDASGPKPFSFANADAKNVNVLQSPAQARLRAIYGAFGSVAKAPYSHNRSLHSILRNSPLPPPSARSPVSPRRQSRRLQEKAARRVGYESPLTQTITTEKYTRSHIDLLAEEATPSTPSPAVEDSEMMLDLAMAYHRDRGDEATTTTTRDGGQTPGPFEEMRRRMNALGTETPRPALSPRPEGVRKRRRKEKKRKWVWTIGNQDDDTNNNNNNNNNEEEGGAMRAIREAAADASSGSSTPRAAKAVPTLPIPRPRPRPRSVKFSNNSGSGKDVDNSNSNKKKAVEMTPEPVTAIRVSSSVEHLPFESESSDASATADRMVDVEMSDDAGGDSSSGGSSSSSRATTPYSMDLDMTTPTLAKSGAPALTVKVELLGTTTTDPSNADPGDRRDTPIPPDLVTNERL